MMTDTLFVTLYDALSRTLTQNMRCADVAQNLHILPDALPGKAAPVILYEAVYRGSASYTGYYPLSEQAYRIALPKISLTRFNRCNLHNNRKQVFTCGLDWRESVGYLYATMDLPEAPKELQAAYNDLFRFLQEVASSLKLNLPPVKLGWYITDLEQRGGRDD